MLQIEQNTNPHTKENNPCNPEDLFEKTDCSLTQIKVYHDAPKPIQTVKNNQGKKAYMKSSPSGRAKPPDDLIIITGGIPVGTEVKREEMDSHAHNQQQGGNPL